MFKVFICIFIILVSYFGYLADFDDLIVFTDFVHPLLLECEMSLGVLF